MTKVTLPKNWPAESDWTAQLESAFAAESFQELTRFVAEERESATIFPPAEETFNAFINTPFAETKVVILGQDPYHGQGQAHGLSFSVQDDIRHPPSLRNIFKELVADTGAEIPESGSLLKWSQQGVLLLNTVLTVRESEANSHRKKGWETFTDEVIRSLNQHPNQIVFVLWGGPAQKKEKLIEDRHVIIKSAHPSPLSAHRGFVGSKPFSKVNQFLSESNQSPIDWNLA